MANQGLDSQPCLLSDPPYGSEVTLDSGGVGELKGLERLLIEVIDAVLTEQKDAEGAEDIFGLDGPRVLRIA